MQKITELFKAHCLVLSVHSRLSSWSKNCQILVIWPIPSTLLQSCYVLSVVAKPSGGKCTQPSQFSFEHIPGLQEPLREVGQEKTVDCYKLCINSCEFISALNV